MKIFVNKKELEWFKEMQSEGRTREINVSTYRQFEDDREVECELLEMCKDARKSK
jgi:hypothetical protein